MDTPRLDRLFRAQRQPEGRRAESADARLEIRREERKDGRKQRERKEREEREAAEADLPRVSIPALKLFLEGLLRDSAAVEAPPPAPAATPARHAAQAYGRNSAAPPPETETGTGTETGAGLSAEEVETIRRLLAELATLGAATPELVLRPEETFLASLAAAIRAAKAESPR
jgi:hypothetical protein